MGSMPSAIRHSQHVTKIRTIAQSPYLQQPSRKDGSFLFNHKTNQYTPDIL